MVEQIPLGFALVSIVLSWGALIILLRTDRRAASEHYARQEDER